MQFIWSLIKSEITVSMTLAIIVDCGSWFLKMTSMMIKLYLRFWKDKFQIFFMRLIWYTKLADFVRYRNVLAIFDDTSKQVRWRKVDFGFIQKNCPFCTVFLENIILTSFILGKLLWKNLTKYKELKKNTTVIVLTKKGTKLSLLYSNVETL